MTILKGKPGKADHLGAALRQALPPIEQLEENEHGLQLIRGRAKFGFGIASGRKENKYGGSTIKRQVIVLHAMATGLVPHLTEEEREHAARMRDYLLRHIPNKNAPGTINIETDLFLVLTKAAHEIAFMWTKHILPFEKFYYIDARLIHENPRNGTERDYKGMLYFPSPATKGNAGGESHIPNRLEAMATEWIEDLQENDPLRVHVESGTFLTMPHTNQAASAKILRITRSKGILQPRPQLKFNQLTREQKDIYKVVSEIDATQWPKLDLAA